MTTATEKISGSPSALESAGTANSTESQENIFFCAHRGHGCISQNGYRCLHGPVCEPVDDQGRRFVVFHWLEKGQPLATRYYLTGKPPMAGIIDSDEANKALRMVAMLRGKTA